MSSLYLDSEPAFVVARQLDLAWFMIPSIMQRKMNPNTDLQDMVCMTRKKKKKKVKKIVKGMQEQNKVRGAAISH